MYIHTIVTFVYLECRTTVISMFKGQSEYMEKTSLFICTNSTSHFWLSSRDFSPLSCKMYFEPETRKWLVRDVSHGPFTPGPGTPTDL